jgi:hypothetical protein
MDTRLMYWHISKAIYMVCFITSRVDRAREFSHNDGQTSILAINSSYVPLLRYVPKNDSKDNVSPNPNVVIDI